MLLLYFQGAPGPPPRSSSLWQSHWQGPLSNWGRYGGREKKEASRQLGSTEWNFFLAARAPQDFKEVRGKGGGGGGRRGEGVLEGEEGLGGLGVEGAHCGKVRGQGGGRAGV